MDSKQRADLDRYITRSDDEPFEAPDDRVGFVIEAPPCDICGAFCDPVCKAPAVDVDAVIRCDVRDDDHNDHSFTASRTGDTWYVTHIDGDDRVVFDTWVDIGNAPKLFAELCKIYLAGADLYHRGVQHGIESGRKALGRDVQQLLGLDRIIGSLERLAATVGGR